MALLAALGRFDGNWASRANFSVVDSAAQSSFVLEGEGEGATPALSADRGGTEAIGIVSRFSTAVAAALQSFAQRNDESSIEMEVDLHQCTHCDSDTASRWESKSEHWRNLKNWLAVQADGRLRA